MDQPTHTDTDASGPEPSVPLDGQPGPRRLRRRPDDGQVAGVCAGVAEYFGLDPVVVRIVTVVLAAMGPGLVVYVLAWIFVPPASGPAQPGRPLGPIDSSDRGTQVLGLVLLGLAITLLVGDWWWPGEWFLPLGLVALGGWLLFRTCDDDGDDDSDPTAVDAPPGGAVPERRDPSPTTPPVPPVAAAGWTAPATSVATGPVPPTPAGPVGPDPTSPIEPPRSSRGRRRRQILRSIVFGSLLVWTAVAYLTGVSLQTGLAVGLLIIGCGFLLGAVIGGSKALIGPAVWVSLLLIAATVLDVPLSGPIGDRTWAPQRLEDVESIYEVSMGSATVDLSALELGEGDELDVAASVGLGKLEVRLPDDVDVTVVSHLGAGSAEILGIEQDGFGVSDERFDEAGSGDLHLDVHVGAGEIEVVRVG